LENRACEQSVSGVENGAEQAENQMSRSGGVSGTFQKMLEWERSIEQQWSREQAKSATQESTHT